MFDFFRRLIGGRKKSDLCSSSPGHHEGESGDASQHPYGGLEDAKCGGDGKGTEALSDDCAEHCKASGARTKARKRIVVRPKPVGNPVPRSRNPKKLESRGKGKARPSRKKSTD
jgi:hypothetical protein